MVSIDEKLSVILAVSVLTLNTGISSNIGIGTSLDITITVSHTKHRKAQQLILPHLHKMYELAITNDLHINTAKTTTNHFTPDSAEYDTTPSLKLNSQTPKIFGITLDLKPTFSQHISVTITKAKQTLNILKVLTSTKWNKQKKLIVFTFKAMTQPSNSQQTI